MIEMKPFYCHRSDQYSKMARKFYAEFLRSKTFYDSGKFIVKENTDMENFLAGINLCQTIDDSYIGAIVFEAMAIESYVNLMGAYLADENLYYRETRKKSTKEKLDYIFEKVGKNFPEELKEKIGKLFSKRNNLVHQKPKAIVIDIENSDRETLMREKRKLDKALFLDFDTIEEDMKLYDELKRTVQVVRGAEDELIDEILKKDDGEK